MKILVVDDSNFLRKTIIKSLKNGLDEIEFIEAASGLEGLEEYKSNRINFIISDLLMPEMTGQEMIKSIRESDLNIPIVIFSADIQDSIKKEVMEYGILKFINKPITPDKVNILINIIKETLC